MSGGQPHPSLLRKRAAATHRHVYEDQLDTLTGTDIGPNRARIEKWRKFKKVIDKADGSVVLPKGMPQDWDNPFNAASGGAMLAWPPSIPTPKVTPSRDDPHAPFRAAIDTARKVRRERVGMPRSMR